MTRNVERASQRKHAEHARALYFETPHSEGDEHKTCPRLHISFLACGPGSTSLIVRHHEVLSVEELLVLCAAVSSSCKPTGAVGAIAMNDEGIAVLAPRRRAGALHTPHTAVLRRLVAVFLFLFPTFNLAVTLPAVWLGFGVGTLAGGASC